MEKVAIFPGSFDPITVGHESVIRRALSFFDKVIVAIGYNVSKNAFFSIDRRIEMIQKVFSDEPNVQIISYEGLTVDLCKKLNVNYIIRGLRTSADFEFERAVAQTNKAMAPNIDTVFLLTAPEHTSINSTIIRDILIHNGDPSQFIPSSINIFDYIEKEK
ncbi:MAG: pantetheine-phosphate adenylyltransferase [Bacteroidales bacterium]|nr:pantetheine-phosphate adenylyltransferase [Bacteroidales bacterium]HRX30475.1 pantetheine-phosphate adenylyltransferase [Tenuifilaceae bacterium]